MKRLIVLCILTGIATTSFAQYGHKFPYAYELITAGNLNTLLGTILQQDTSALPGLSTKFSSVDNGTQITLAYVAHPNPESAQARLKQSADSNTIEIANAKPTLPYTSIDKFELGGNGANIMVGNDAFRGSLIRVQFTMDKYLLTFEMIGVPPEKVRESLPEMYKIIKQNSGLQEGPR